MGEIKLPQVVSFQERMTVLDSILMANGLTDIAKPEGTKVYRKNRTAGGNSEIQIIPVEMGRVIFEGDLSENIRLQPGDTSMCREAFFDSMVLKFFKRNHNFRQVFDIHI